MELQKTENTGLILVKSILSKSKPIAQLEMSLKVSDTITKPVIREVFRDNDEIGFTFISAIVKRFIDSFGFSTKMTETQLEMLTIDTLEKFGHESVEDVILFFKMARSGQLGTTNRGVDSNLIFGTWFPLYMDLKSYAREEQSNKSKEEINVDQRGTTKEAVLKAYKKSDNLDAIKKCKEHIHKITRDMSRDTLESEILQWEKDDYKKNFVKYLKPYRRILKNI